MERILFFFRMLDRREVARKSRLINSVRTCTDGQKDGWRQNTVLENVGEREEMEYERRISNRVTRYNFNEFLDGTKTTVIERLTSRTTTTTTSKRREER